VPTAVSNDPWFEVARMHAWFLRQTLLLPRLPHNPRTDLPNPVLLGAVAMASSGIADSRFQQRELHQGM